MKVVMMLAMLAVAVAAPHGEERLRRLLPGDIDLMGRLIAHFNNVITNAKLAFTSLVTAAGHAIDFDHVVQLMVPMINTKTTQAACKTVCVTEASHLGLAVLGSVLSPACNEVCHAAFAEIQLKLYTSGR